MEVCDGCMDEDILLRRFDNETGEYDIFCVDCVLEGYFEDGLTPEDYSDLEEKGINKKTFLEDIKQIYSFTEEDIELRKEKSKRIQERNKKLLEGSKDVE